MVFLFFIPPMFFVSRCVSLIAGIFVNMVVGIADFLADLPAASVHISASFYSVWLGVCLVIIGISLIFAKTVYGKSTLHAEIPRSAKSFLRLVIFFIPYTMKHGNGLSGFDSGIPNMKT